MRSININALVERESDGITVEGHVDGPIRLCDSLLRDPRHNFFDPANADCGRD